MVAHQSSTPERGPTQRTARLGAFVTRHDPGHLAIKRSIRAAVVMPGAFAFADLVIGNPQTSLFAAFGSFALLLLVDFPGSPRTRLISYLATFFVGAAFISIGTACSTHPVLAVAAMGIVGFAVLFCGIFSPQAATGTVAILLTFVLPVAVAAPPSAIPDRLLGWVIAGLCSITACLLVWPRPWHDDLRRHLSGAANALSSLVQAHAEGRRGHVAGHAASAQLTQLRSYFEATPYPPTGATPGAGALAKLVGRMEWVGTNAMTSDPEAPTLTLLPVRAINAEVAETLRAVSSLLCDGQGHPVHTPSAIKAVLDHRDELGRLRMENLGSQVSHFIADEVAPARPTASEDGARLLSAIDPTFHARALGMATELVANATLEASGAWTHAGAAGSETVARAPGWLYRGQSSMRDLLRTHLSFRSIWFRNALRGAIGLALAVAVVEITDVEHGFWVVLGTLSVLRSNALGTGATALRAIAGTVVGFVIGSLILIALGNHDVLLWAVLPLAVLVAGIAPTMISFAAGQAGFTVTVVILFNIIVPTGWKVGLTRVEDVVLGCAVSVVVGLLFWPRGAVTALGRALADAFAASSDYLGAAVERIAEPGRATDIEARRTAAQSEYLRLDDAFRQYVWERGAKTTPMEAVSDLFTGAGRLHLAAFQLAILPEVPAEAGPPVPAVAEAGTALEGSCDDSRAWLVAIGELLRGDRGDLGSLAPTDEHLKPLLIRAFDDARRAGRADLVRVVLRMLWAAEVLDDGRALSGDLARSAELFGRRHPADLA